MVFGNLSILVLLAKVASALEGLNHEEIMPVCHAPAQYGDPTVILHHRITWVTSTSHLTHSDIYWTTRLIHDVNTQGHLLNDPDTIPILFIM